MAPIFELIDQISFGKRPLTETQMEGYIPFMVNRHFSMFADTIFYANDMNMNYHLPNTVQASYMISTTSKRKRLGKWMKAQNDAHTQAVGKMLGLSAAKADEVAFLYTPEDVKLWEQQNDTTISKR